MSARVVKRDGTVGPPARMPRQCPPHRFTMVKRVNGVEVYRRCCNCGKHAAGSGVTP